MTVNANTAAVETAKTEVSTTINLNDMMNLPLNGRRWDAFVLTTPGASNDGSFGLITFRGLSGLYNNNIANTTTFGHPAGFINPASTIVPLAVWGEFGARFTF